MERLSERVVLRRKHSLEMEFSMRMCGMELRNVIRREQPDLGDVVFESARDEGRHVLENVRDPLAEESQPGELVKSERLAAVLLVTLG